MGAGVPLPVPDAVPVSVLLPVAVPVSVLLPDAVPLPEPVLAIDGESELPGVELLLGVSEGVPEALGVDEELAVLLGVGVLLREMLGVLVRVGVGQGDREGERESEGLRVALDERLVEGVRLGDAVVEGVRVADTAALGLGLGRMQMNVPGASALDPTPKLAGQEVGHEPTDSLFCHVDTSTAPVSGSSAVGNNTRLASQLVQS